MDMPSPERVRNVNRLLRKLKAQEDAHKQAVARAKAARGIR